MSKISRKILVLGNQARILYLTRFELIKELLDRGDELFVSVPESPYAAPFTEAGCRVIDTPLDRRGLTPRSDYKLRGAYREIIKDIRPDIILTFTIKPNIYGVRAATKLGIPAIPTITGLGSSIQKRGFLQKTVFSLYRSTFKRVPVVFLQNTANAELFRLLGMARPTQIRLVAGSGVNLEKTPFQPYPDPEKPVRFLFIGRLMEEKGINEYIEAACRLRQVHPEVRFGILGYSEESDILGRVKKLSEEGVIDYFGYTSDVRPYIAEAHAVVLPSWHEGMANTLLEAAASGRPVIASRIAGCLETFSEGETGFGVRPRDVDNLYRRLTEFMALPHEKRAAMGAAGRAKMEREFDRRQVNETYLEEIDRVLGEKTPPPKD
ncbi:MAG: glycosyltransferase family 4 protein [Thermoguttaceae bacterium]|nr:glycosyltransferase family 4 protein [Thermoguttaceae bacterium]